MPELANSGIKFANSGICHWKVVVCRQWHECIPALLLWWDWIIAFWSAFACQTYIWHMDCILSPPSNWMASQYKCYHGCTVRQQFNASDGLIWCKWSGFVGENLDFIITAIIIMVLYSLHDIILQTMIRYGGFCGMIWDAFVWYVQYDRILLSWIVVVVIWYGNL